jgi:hypothetical protein
MTYTSDRPAQKKQLDIVLNLNRLTKEEKIEWEWGDGGEETAHPRVLCSADWKGHRVQILEGNSPERTKLSVHGSQKPDDVWIRVRSRDDDEVRIVIPPMSAISDLVDTIERKAGLDARDTSDPQALDEFNQLLEEEL